MRLLLITNLFPPQELGGYGRSMADFAWGLEQRGHELMVLCSDAPYLPQLTSDMSLAASVDRNLVLKGDFRNGVHHLLDTRCRDEIDKRNQKTLSRILEKNDFNGVLLGNLDLLGPEILAALKNTDIPIIHHIGYVSPPFAPGQHPKITNYHQVAASKAVREALITHGERSTNLIHVVYPGARCDIFKDSTQRSLPAPLGPEITVQHKLGSSSRPLKICFAGLLMSTKGAHTIAQAIVILKSRGIHTKLSIAGGEFQKEYGNAIRNFLKNNNIDDCVDWYGQLSRPQLVKFFRLHHTAVFPSIHPEAFGIVAAEAMASGLVLISSGVGGAAELFEDGDSGLLFQANEPESLAGKLEQLVNTPPAELRILASKGQQRAEEKFSVSNASAELERLFQEFTNRSNRFLNLGHITD